MGLGLRRATRMGQENSESLAQLQRRQPPAARLMYGHLQRLRSWGSAARPGPADANELGWDRHRWGPGCGEKIAAAQLSGYEMTKCPDLGCVPW